MKQGTASRIVAGTLAAIGMAAFAGCVSVADQIATLKQYDAISDSPANGPDADYSVLVRNLRPLGVDLGTKQTRERLVVAYLGERCPAGRTVSETELATRTPGLARISKDYAIRVKC